MNKTKSLTEEMIEDYAKEPNRGYTPVATDDALENIFIDALCYPDWLKQNGYEKMKFYEYADEYDKFRLKYDGDARYYYSILNDPVTALHGDTITSIYTPYKRMLELKTGIEYHKRDNPFETLIKNKNEPGYKETNEIFAEFAKLSQSAGNFMLLPHRDMNPARYWCSQDRIDKSLYECFPDGGLATFFGIAEETQIHNLTQWIETENLSFMFENGIIERDKIIPFNKNNPYVTYSDMTEEELIEFIDNAILFIMRKGEIMISLK